MKQDQIKKIVWDVDNTLWDWVAYAVRTYPAMSEVLAKEVGISRERVAAAMQDYYTEAQTIESSWLVQGLDEQGLFEGRDVDKAKLITKLQRRFHAVRTKSLALYEGITEVLEVADEANVDNIILTDAPAYQATSRIRHLKVEQSLFHSMYAQRDGMFRLVPEPFQLKYSRGGYDVSIPVLHLSKEKPDVDLEAVLGMSREEIQKHVVIVGDNYAKDMELAKRYDCLGIHAKWGQASSEQIDVLKQFAPINVMRRNLFVGSAVTTPGNIIPAQEPRDILDVLGWQ